MSTIYVVFPGIIPQFEALQEILLKTHKVVLVDKVESLSQYRDENGVVIIGGTPSRVNALAAMIHTIAPRMGCIVVVEADTLEKIEQASVEFADVLTTPFHHPLEVYCRVNTAMQISELRGIIESSAQIDEVTGLYNQQFFMKRLGQEMSLSKRHLSPVTCVIISLSYYEVYLDSYGFGFIANLLQQVAKVAREQVRNEDIVARIADNEIALILPCSTEKGALSLISRILKKVEDMPVYMGDQEEHLHLKAGIAAYPSPDEVDMDIDTLVRYARHALHQARCSESKNTMLFSEMKPFVG